MMSEIVDLVRLDKLNSKLPYNLWEGLVASHICFCLGAVSATLLKNARISRCRHCSLCHVCQGLCISSERTANCGPWSGHTRTGPKLRCQKCAKHGLELSREFKRTKTLPTGVCTCVRVCASVVLNTRSHLEGTGFCCNAAIRSKAVIDYLPYI